MKGHRSSSRRSLTRSRYASPQTDHDPAWSPDGEVIAFSSDRDGDFDIYLARSDGSAVGQIVNDPGNDENPAWSPDGEQIALYSDRDGNREIYVVDRDGRHPRNWPSLHLYLRRHSQQGAGLAAIRTFSATTIIGLLGSGGLALWVFVNGSLWLWGSICGLRQVGRGDSWLLRRLGEAALLAKPPSGAGPAKVLPHAPASPAVKPSAALPEATTPRPIGRSRLELLNGGTMNATRVNRPTSSEDLAHGQIVIVTARWILVFAGLVLALWNSTHVGQLRVQILFILGLAFANFYLHAQILMRRPAIRSVIYAASAADLTVISVNVLASGGFDSQTFAFYFPALLVLSVAFLAAMTLLYTGATVGFYSLIGLAAAAFDDADLQTVVIRDLMLVAVAVCGALYLHMETRRREESMPGELRAVPGGQENEPAEAQGKAIRQPRRRSGTLR